MGFGDKPRFVLLPRIRRVSHFLLTAASLNTYFRIASTVILKSQLSRWWNFSKAHWSNFTRDLDYNIRFILLQPRNYQKFTNTIVKAAKKHISRDIRRQYIPRWNEAIKRLYEDYVENGRAEIEPPGRN